MRSSYFLLLFIFAALGCQDHNHPRIKTVIPSAKVADEDVHMSVYSQTDDTATNIYVYAHRHHDGYAQYLELSENDSLTAQSEEWIAEFSAVSVPDETDPVQVYYEAQLDDATAERLIELQFVRNDSPLLEAQLIIPAVTEFNVTADSDPVDLQSTVHVEWVANELYSYALRFDFSCMLDEREIKYARRYPLYGAEPLESPFDLDLALLPGPPEGVSDCEVAVKLFGQYSQTANQTVTTGEVDVKAVRVQETVLPIALAI